MDDAASGTLDSALDSVLCTLNSVLDSALDAALDSALLTLSLSARADRPRSAAGMGSGFVSRSDDVPDLMPNADQQRHWSLPTRGTQAVRGWRLAA